MSAHRFRTLAALTLLLATIASSQILAQSTGPAIPDSVSFQGSLTDSAGIPIDTSGISMTFKLYDGLTMVWEQTHGSVIVTNGVFDVILGGSGPASLGPVAFNQPLDLGITVGSDSEISPRTALTAAAYALAIRGMYAVDADDGVRSGPNIIGGDSHNHVAAGVVGATISGGGGIASNGVPQRNRVQADWGTVGGGRQNRADSTFATVAGGNGNYATGLSSAIGGGQVNRATEFATTIAGGWDHDATGWASTIAGGYENDATDFYATVGGGRENASTGSRSVIAGGERNTTTAYASTVGGGVDNLASGRHSVVGGGDSNVAADSHAVVPGGYENEARKAGSFAAGSRARAMHRGSFVWGDRTLFDDNDSLETTGSNQFLIQADGGVGIGTNDPDGQLHVLASDPTGSDEAQIIVEGTAQSGDFATGGGIAFAGHDGNNPRVWSWIRGMKENSSDGSASGYLGFATRGSGGTLVERARFGSGGHFLPFATDVYTLGTSGKKWDAVYAANGTIQTSDRRLKTDVSDLSYGLLAVQQLRPVSFRWTNRAEHGIRLGLIAQETLEIIPEVVEVPQDESEYMGMRYANLVPVLIKAIQEQQAIIDELTVRVESMENAMGSH